MLDADLAELYRVPTKSLNLAVKRNGDRFPEDFMFQLTDDEAVGLRFHFKTSKRVRGGRRYSSFNLLGLSAIFRAFHAVQIFNSSFEELPSHRKKFRLDWPYEHGERNHRSG